MICIIFPVVVRKLDKVGSDTLCRLILSQLNKQVLELNSETITEVDQPIVNSVYSHIIGVKIILK